MISNAPPGLSHVAQEATDESLQNPASASDAVVARVAKRDVPNEARHMRGAEAAAKARAKRDETVAQSQTRPRQGRDEHLPPVRKSGIMLVRLQDQEAMRKTQQLKFQLTSDPVDFVDKVVKVPARHQKVHVVLAPPRRHRFYAECADRCGTRGRILRHATGFSRSGRIAARHHVRSEVQEPE